MDCTWPVFIVSLDTGFDRWRPRRQPGPALMRDDYGRRLWGFRMDMNGTRDLIKAAVDEMAAQAAEGADLRCDDCGMFTPRWLLDSVDPRDRNELRTYRNGVEVLRCAGCWSARSAGLPSRLEFGRALVEVWA